MSASNPPLRITARRLQKKWNVNVQHALYHRFGAWYHVLKSFPAGLFDPTGYVLFETKDEYLTSTYLRHGAHLHVEGGIRRMPGYVLRNSPLPPAQPTPRPSDIRSPARVRTTTYRILRDTELARRVKAACQHRCQICGHTLMLLDGSVYAEAHHIKPLGAPHQGPDIPENIICVCPNHHAALDYGVMQLEKAQLTGLHRETIADEFIDYHNNRVVQEAKISPV